MDNPLKKKTVKFQIELEGRTYTVKVPPHRSEPRYRILDENGWGIDTIWNEPDGMIVMLEAERDALQLRIDRIRAAEAGLEIRGLKGYPFVEFDRSAPLPNAAIEKTDQTTPINHR